MKWICLFVFTIGSAAICCAQSENKKDSIPPMPRVLEGVTSPLEPFARPQFDPAEIVGSIIVLDALIIQMTRESNDDGSERKIRHEVEMLVQELKTLTSTPLQESTLGKNAETKATQDETSLRQFAFSPLRDKRVSELVHQHDGMTILSRPGIQTLPGIAAVVSIEKESTLPYMEQVDEETFKLRYTTPQNLGIDLSVTVSELHRPNGGNGSKRSLTLSPIKLAVTAIDGRSPMKGIDLPIGPPIVSRRTIETSVELPVGELATIELPVAKGKHVFMIVSSRQ